MAQQLCLSLTRDACKTDKRGFGNASHPDWAGKSQLKKLIEKATAEVTSLMGSQPEELVINSGGSQAEAMP